MPDNPKQSDASIMNAVTSTIQSWHRVTSRKRTKAPEYPRGGPTRRTVKK